MRFAFLLLALALATGCASPSVRTEPAAGADAPTPARQLADEGRHA